MSDQTAVGFINNVLYSVNIITKDEVDLKEDEVSRAEVFLTKKKNGLAFEALFDAIESIPDTIDDEESDDDLELDKCKDQLLVSVEKMAKVPLNYIVDEKPSMLDMNDEILSLLGIEPEDQENFKAQHDELSVSISAEKNQNGSIKEAIEGIADIEALKEFIKGDIYTKSLGHLNTLKEVFDKSKIKSKGVFEFTIKEVEIDRLLMQIAALSYNDCLPDNQNNSKKGSSLLFNLKDNINKQTHSIDISIQNELDDVLHQSEFQNLEANWLSLEYLIDQTDFSKDIKIDLLDVTKQELEDDFAENRRDIANSSLFKKLYTQEYDQYGGQPYSAMIGLYEFENSERDISWLRTMGKIANAAHCTFVSSVGPKFFVGHDDINQLAEIKNLESHMLQGKFAKWNEFRDSDEAAYLAFAVPRFMIRPPYDMDDNPVPGLNYSEKVKSHKDYSWANAAILFARNIVHSYEETSWCQTVRGPKNGGHIPNLASHTFKQNGLTLTKVPVEIVMPDYRELEFAKAGFMPLVYQKETTNACFFSCQSIKKPKRFKDPKDTENSQLVTNLSYTLSITKIAHYIKCIMRDNIGGTADAPYITNTISTWLNNYVTTVVNPDDLTLRSYPFKAINVDTVSQEGDIGWFKCTVSVSPHLQFEGLDAELRLETQL